jgi:hypothetical protein
MSRHLALYYVWVIKVMGMKQLEERSIFLFHNLMVTLMDEICNDEVIKYVTNIRNVVYYASQKMNHRAEFVLIMSIH